MDYPDRMKTEIKSHFRKSVTIERRAEKEIEKSCDTYHAWCDAEKSVGNKPLTIIAEGDSWFKYVIGKAVIFQLSKLMEIEIQNLASPGDEASEMLSPRKLRRLAKLLKRGPTAGWKYDCMLFSGGGNDLVGRDRFHKWLHPYETGMTPEQILNRQTIKAALSILQTSYEELIDARDKNSPNTQLFFHSYDFAIPDGRRACWLGPWLQPGLETRKIPKTKRREVVSLFLKDFDSMLDRLAKKHESVTVIQTQGTLANKDWANELHPTNSGFRKIAKVFQTEINQANQ